MTDRYIYVDVLLLANLVRLRDTYGRPAIANALPNRILVSFPGVKIDSTIIYGDS